MDLDFVAGAAEARRAALRSKRRAAIVAGFAFNRESTGRKDCRGVKQGAVMLAAIEAVAKADAGGGARRGDADLAAEAAAGDAVHARIPQ